VEVRLTYDPAGPLPDTNFRAFGNPGNTVLSLAWEGLRRWTDALRYGVSWSTLSGRETVSASPLTNDWAPDSEDFYMPCFRHDQTDDLSILFSLPPEWDGGTVYPRISFIPLSSASGTIVFGWRYAWVSPGKKLGWVSDSPYLYCSVNASDANTDINAGPPGVPVSNSITKRGAKLLVYLWRSASRDTYDTDKTWGLLAEANVALSGVCLYYRRTLFGSKEVET
jgi:hypothetical protein